MKLRAGLALCFCTLSHAASAHAMFPGVGGFYGGLLHPLVPAHALLLLALGLLIGGQAPRWRLAIPAFALGAAGGLGSIAAAVGETPAPLVILVCAAIAGVLVAVARPLPRGVGLGLALIAGTALGLDSPPDAISLREATLMLIGTGCGAVLALLLVTTGRAMLRRDSQRIGARVLGSWIAASAVLVLAFSLR